MYAQVALDMGCRFFEEEKNMLRQSIPSFALGLSMRSLRKRLFPLDAKTKRILQLVQSGLACLGLFVCVFILVLFLSTSAREGSYTLFTAWIFDDAEESIQDGSAQLGQGAQTNNNNAVSDQQSGTDSTDLTLADLSPTQAKVAKWISLRYNVAIDPLVPLIAEAWTLGPQMGVKPTLLLAVAAIESRFNPIAQSHFGAQGLMQVRTSVHEERYDEHGGLDMVFDPVVNMRVGANILEEYIRRFGGIEKGLNAYVGAAYSGNHNGYAGKVFGVQKRLDAIVEVTKKTTTTESKARSEAAATPK